MIVETFNKALKYVNSNPSKAELMFDRLLKKAQFKEAYVNLAVACRHLEKFDKARNALAKARDPKMPFSNGDIEKVYDIANANLGLLEYTFERDDEAERLYMEALAVTPDHADTMWNLALTRLRKYCSGKDVNLQEAWSMYEYRFKRTNPFQLRVTNPNMKNWDFKSHVPSLVVLAEQGMGDMIMFSRYFKYLEQYTDKLYIQSTAEFDGLYGNNGIDTPAEYGVPVCSLGKLLNYIPDGKWLASKYVPKVGGEFSIACNWGGSSIHVNNHYRSTDSKHFLSLAKYGKLYTIGPNGPTKGFTHLPSFTWLETIAQLEKVDLVISVDTSLVHICGSLGKPCWVLMPRLETDWRWGDSSIGFDNMWYDSVSVIRNKNNWDSVFAEVEKLLDGH